jgi:hypothetical protein
VAATVAAAEVTVEEAAEADVIDSSIRRETDVVESHSRKCP